MHNQGFSNMTHLKSANRNAGLHFFSSGAMKFFDSKINPTLKDGFVFVTSEQFRGHGHCADGQRLYTLRYALPDASIDELTPFQALAGPMSAWYFYRCLRAGDPEAVANLATMWAAKTSSEDKLWAMRAQLAKLPDGHPVRPIFEAAIASFQVAK